MKGYDREWTSSSGLPVRSRLRFGLTKRSGVPVRFLVQLEYRHGEDWLPIARFDHDGFGPAYRDVERVGLHLDVYDPDGVQIEKVTHFPPLPANEAMSRAEEYLRGRAERLAPETHHAQAEMATERGEEYDPYEAERRAREWAEAAPDPFEDAEPIE